MYLVCVLFKKSLDAIREAIVNAIVPRDYWSSSKVQVRIFNDYIEVWNPSVLHEELNTKNLMTWQNIQLPET